MADRDLVVNKSASKMGLRTVFFEGSMVYNKSDTGTLSQQSNQKYHSLIYHKRRVDTSSNTKKVMEKIRSGKLEIYAL